jgi:acid phosphatase type 7
MKIVGQVFSRFSFFSRFNIFSRFLPFAGLGWLVIGHFCLFQINLQANDDPEMLFLTWQSNPQTSMTIQWLSSPDVKEEQVHFIGEEGAWQNAQATSFPLPEKAPYNLHRIELTQLRPGALYRFKIGSNGKEYKFRTIPSDPKATIRFAVGGDVYHDNPQFVTKTNQTVSRYQPMFVLLGGDLAYSYGLPFWKDKENIQRWFDWLKMWKEQMVTQEGLLIPLIPAIGNHEVKGGFNKTPGEARMFYALFPMPGPQGYNVLDFSPEMSIFMLDSGHTHPVYGLQTNWLSSNLESRTAKKHKFVFYHVPAYPAVRSFFDLKNKMIRDYWVPLFETHRISAAFEHHDHVYKRTHPLKNGKIDQEGVIYLGDGAWGVESARIPKKAEYLAKTASTRHFILVEVSPSKRHYWAISSEGLVIDFYTQVVP